MHVVYAMIPVFSNIFRNEGNIILLSEKKILYFETAL